MADVLRLGDFTFQPDDMPEGIPLGGEHMLAVFKYPGGGKEVQAFGAHDDNPAWSGTFNYTDAVQKVRVIDKMYRSGAVYPLQIGELTTRYGVIKSFKWTYHSKTSIDYSIELELAPKVSQLSASKANTSGTPAPSTAASAPAQRTYTVVSGDSLWSIAQKFYGDGSQYRKIADANNIPDPDLVLSGTKLVIP